MTTTYQIGQELRILKNPGYTGTVIMIDVNNDKYLLDCYPGALNYYNWIWLRDENGKPHLYAANWFDEVDLAGI